MGSAIFLKCFHIIERIESMRLKIKLKRQTFDISVIQRRRRRKKAAKIQKIERNRPSSISPIPFERATAGDGKRGPAHRKSEKKMPKRLSFTLKSGIFILVVALLRASTASQRHPTLAKAKAGSSES
jgi:hypothetical protein